MADPRPSSAAAPIGRGRAPNPIDFWRGFALLQIFVDHVPGNIFEHLTSKNVSISDSAEILIFIAGWSSTFGRSKTFRTCATQAASRFAKLVVIHLALMAVAASVLILWPDAIDNELRHRLLSASPSKLISAAVTLRLQLPYVDILPLYALFAVLSPLLLILDRHRSLVLGASVAAWLIALLFGIGPTAWPAERPVFFDPLSWQLLFVIGYIARRDVSMQGKARFDQRSLRWCAATSLMVGAALVIRHQLPDAGSVEDGTLLGCLLSKRLLGVLRLTHFGALLIVAPVLYRLAECLPAALGMICLVGQRALRVFVAGTLIAIPLRLSHQALHLPWVFIDIGVGLGLLLLLSLATRWPCSAEPARNRSSLAARSNCRSEQPGRLADCHPASRDLTPLSGSLS